MTLPIDEQANVQEYTAEKDPCAVALGRKGGQAGGHARAAKLSPERRSEIATRAALARWGSAATTPALELIEGLAQQHERMRDDLLRERMEHQEIIARIDIALARLSSVARPTPVRVHRGTAAKLLEALAEHPQMPIAELAKALYGDVSAASRSNVSQLLRSQKILGRVLRVSWGRWEVRPTEGMKEELEK